MRERINIRRVAFDSVTFDEAVTRLTDALVTCTQTALYTPNSEIVQACVEDPWDKSASVVSGVMIP